MQSLTFCSAQSGLAGCICSNHGERVNSVAYHTKDAEALQEKNDLKIETYEEYPQPR